MAELWAEALPPDEDDDDDDDGDDDDDDSLMTLTKKALKTWKS